MIRYRRLYESENPDIKLYDVVRCSVHKWYVIDIKGDILTLLAKDNYFGRDKFDNEESNEYKTSEIRAYLRHDVLPGIRRNVNPIPTELEDVGCTDEVWLLSVDEAKKLPENIRKFDKFWWLRSPGEYDDDAANVTDDGDILGSYVGTSNFAVRPAMRVHMKDLV